MKTYIIVGALVLVGAVVIAVTSSRSSDEPTVDRYAHKRHVVEEESVRPNEATVRLPASDKK